jgi:hypothetical protein
MYAVLIAILLLVFAILSSGPYLDLRFDVSGTGSITTFGKSHQRA